MASRRIAPSAPDVPDELEPGAIGPLESGMAWSRMRLDGDSAAGLAAPGLQFEQARLERVDLSGGRFANLSLGDVDLDGCNLANVDARGGAMTRTLLVRCRLTGLSWTEGVLRDVVLRECRIDLASFAATRLEQVVFDRCLLSHSEWQDARLRYVRFDQCDLSESDLTGATFAECELRGCTIDGLRGVDRLRGVAMPWDDVLASAGTFAAALGVRVLDD